MTIVGPIKEYADRHQQKWVRQRERFVGDRLRSSDPQALRVFLKSLLTKIFRRPATGDEIDAYVDLVSQEMKSSGSVDRGMHLAIRTALISPAFLYRSIGPGDLTDFEPARTFVPVESLRVKLLASSAAAGEPMH